MRASGSMATKPPLQSVVYHDQLQNGSCVESGGKTDLDFLCPHAASPAGSLGHPSCLGVDCRTHRCTEVPDCSFPKAVADLAEVRTGKEVDLVAAVGQADAPR